MHHCRECISKSYNVQCVHEKMHTPKYNGIVFKILGKHQWNFYNWI